MSRRVKVMWEWWHHAVVNEGWLKIPKGTTAQRRSKDWRRMRRKAYAMEEGIKRGLVCPECHVRTGMGYSHKFDCSRPSARVLE